MNSQVRSAGLERFRRKVCEILPDRFDGPGRSGINVLPWVQAHVIDFNTYQVLNTLTFGSLPAEEANRIEQIAIVLVRSRTIRPDIPDVGETNRIP